MKKFATLLAAIGFSATASLAIADTAQLELMPVVGGAEITQFVSEKAAPAVANDSSFYNLGTGGISPQ